MEVSDDARPVEELGTLSAEHGQLPLAAAGQARAAQGAGEIPLPLARALSPAASAADLSENQGTNPRQEVEVAEGPVPATSSPATQTDQQHVDAPAALRGGEPVHDKEISPAGGEKVKVDEIFPPEAVFLLLTSLLSNKILDRNVRSYYIHESY